MKTPTEEVPITARLARAIASVEAAPKDGSNPMFKSKYITLDGVLSVVKPALREQGLALTQTSTFVNEGNMTKVKTSVVATDDGGRMDLGETLVPMVKLDAQAMGSAATYARRYALMAIFALEADDDDGNAASHGATVREPKATNGEASAHDLPPQRKLTPARPVRVPATEEADPFLT
jgi:hypothetical protein